MAYSNWEGKAFRNGEHFHEGCDATAAVPDFGHYTFHAMLGQGSVRVATRKSYPYLLVENEDVFDMHPLEGMVERDGYSAFAHSVGNFASIMLVEPDGTVWTGLAGYEAYESWCEEDR